ncbi:MAG: ABC transporter permease [Firmicutes bacterium GWF2_51_9]|nr:MAG: ABC transporter permease [Firmicutes bacterium GWF2_51_9]HAM62160.1 sugar ABC transporter permease [Erysipelotrichaceae bacterium]HBZ41724.1 sugar ABC transporter permease [Erysipelotrichaceae bacterium]
MKKSLKYKYRNELEVLPFLLPGFILLLIFIFYPIAKNFYMSLSDYNIFLDKMNTFTGIDNYIRVFKDKMFWDAFINTAAYAVVTILPQMAIGLILAIIINTKIKGSFLFRILFYIPVITSWLIVSLIFRYLFESGDAGLINYLLLKANLIETSISWFSNRWTANAVIWILAVWKGIGWNMVVFLAGLQGIDRSYYEAADIDGANIIQKVRFITIPLLKPVTFFIMTNLLVGSFNVFTQVYVMTNGAPMGRTQVLLSYMYKVAFTDFQIGYSSALSVVVGVFIFILAMGQQKFLNMGYKEGQL